MHYILMVIAIPAIFWAGGKFYRGAIKSAQKLTADMNTLIAIGTFSAFSYSVLATVYPQFFTSRGLEVHVYYDTAVMIIAFILPGKMLEAKAKGKTSAAIYKLLDLKAKTARVVIRGMEKKLTSPWKRLGRATWSSFVPARKYPWTES